MEMWTSMHISTSSKINLWLFEACEALASDFAIYRTFLQCTRRTNLCRNCLGVTRPVSTRKHTTPHQYQRKARTSFEGRLFDAVPSRK
jgi:hypothetical protein